MGRYERRGGSEGVVVLRRWGMIVSEGVVEVRNHCFVFAFRSKTKRKTWREPFFVRWIPLQGNIFFLFV